MRATHERFWREHVEPLRLLAFSTREYGRNGAFRLKHLNIIASVGEGWEHVSVSTMTRTPTYEEMCQVKDLFWRPEECVMQLHVPAEQHVNNHRYCLHLWKPLAQAIPTPPSRLVGYKELGDITDGICQITQSPDDSITQSAGGSHGG